MIRKKARKKEERKKKRDGAYIDTLMQKDVISTNVSQLLSNNCVLNLSFETCPTVQCSNVSYVN